jgi:DNA-binding GntR family transcriptional regulator
MVNLDGIPDGARRTAHEYVRDSIRQAILRGSLRGGTRLVQGELAEELGVSTTPVREALRDLATEGLVHLDAHRGAVVRSLTYDDLLQIRDLTKLLEPEAVRLAAAVVSRERSWLDECEALADEMEATSDIGEWADLNRRFHERMVSCVDRDRLLGILRGLRDAAAPYVGLAMQQRGYPLELANRHHRQIIAAMRAADADGAAAIASDHVDLAWRTLEDARYLFAEG